jgi:polyisoprenoid-binding protein YceI
MLQFHTTMRISLALAVALTASASLADSRTYEIRKGGKSVAEFHAEDSYDAFDGKTNGISGTIVADPANPSAATVNLTVDMTSLDTGVALRNREMGELYLESGKYPNATFKSVSVEGPQTIEANQPVEIKVTGDFALHGVTKRLTLPVRIVLIPDGRIHATSMFRVKLPDFGINVPQNILVTVEDMVPVRLDVWATAK